MNNRIALLRKTLSLTLEEFGKRVGVTRSAISNIENGKRNLTDQMILSICREFNANENWIKTGQGEMFTPEPENEFDIFAKNFNLNDFERNFLERYLRLGKREREAVTAFMEALAGESINAFLGAIPKTPEELESQYPPVSDSTHKAI